MNSHIFSDEFLNRLIKFLDSKCIDGLCITRSDVCEGLGIDAKFDGAIGAIINLELIEGYEMHKGPNGGIGKKGVSPPKKGKDANTFPKGFLDELRKNLTKLVNSNKPTPRKVIAKAMGSPGSKTENLISAAIKLPSFRKEYIMKNGRFGGVLKTESDKNTSGTELKSYKDDTNIIGLDRPLEVKSLDKSLEEKISGPFCGPIQETDDNITGEASLHN